MQQSSHKELLVIQSMRIELSRDCNRIYMKRLKTQPNIYGKEIFSPKKMYNCRVQTEGRRQEELKIQKQLFLARKKLNHHENSLNLQLSRWKSIEKDQYNKIKRSISLQKQLNLSKAVKQRNMKASVLKPSIDNISLKEKQRTSPLDKISTIQSYKSEQSKRDDLKLIVINSQSQKKRTNFQLINRIQRQISVRPLCISINLPYLSNKQQHHKLKSQLFKIASNTIQKHIRESPQNSIDKEAMKEINKLKTKINLLDPIKKTKNMHKNIDISPWLASSFNTTKNPFYL